MASAYLLTLSRFVCPVLYVMREGTRSDTPADLRPVLGIPVE
jgi:hypothetical protein